MNIPRQMPTNVGNINRDMSSSTGGPRRKVLSVEDQVEGESIRRDVTTSAQLWLFPDEARIAALVFRANELDQVRIQHDFLVDLHRKWFRICGWVVDRNLDFQVSIIHAPELLGK